MTAIVIDYAPRSYFVPFHARHQRYACIVAHRQAGKTTACIHELQKAALLCRRPRPRFAYIAPLLKQAKTVAWDTLKAAAEPLRRHGMAINEAELRVDYQTGAQIKLYGADNPDSLRGIYLDGVVIDEPAQVDPTLWPEIISPTLAMRDGWAAFIGTPKGRDSFYREWRTASTDQANWYAIRLPASKTRIIPEQELAHRRSLMSEAQYAREYECSFDEPDIDQFIDALTVEAARQRKGVGTGPRVMGLDVARFGDDRTVLVFRNGDLVAEDSIVVWRGLDLMQTAARAAEEIAKWRPQAIMVDGVGVGGGVVDRLRQMNVAGVIEVNGGSRASKDERYVNRRAEMWATMRDWLKDRGAIPNRDDLGDDLTAPCHDYDHRNRVRLERKEDLKGRGLPSPDIGDALALTFAQPVVADPRMLDARSRFQAAPVDNPLAGF